jgi:hypothetical protein
MSDDEFTKEVLHLISLIEANPAVTVIIVLIVTGCLYGLWRFHKERKK